MSNKPLPIPLSMVLCDTIIEDRKTAKKSLIGLFSTVTTAQVPCVLGRFGVFISLTEGIDEYSCSLQCVFSDDNSVIGEIKGSIKFRNRRDIVEIALDIGGINLLKFGDYRLDLYCDQSLLISRTFTVSPPAQPATAS